MDINEILNLHDKPASYQFSDEDMKKIKKAIPKSNYNIRYSLYNKNSSQGLYITFIIDGKCNHPRRSGVENNWKTICERPISNKEYKEIVENFGTNNRRFQVWYYQYIQELIDDDKKYGIETPEKFIKLCKEKGYVEKNRQLTLEI